MENTKCMTSASCMDADAQSNAAECTYTAWSEWMPCSVTCGVGTTLRKRFLAGVYIVFQRLVGISFVSELRLKTSFRSSHRLHIS